MEKFNAYEMEKRDELITESEKSFFKTTILFLPLLTFWWLVDKTKQWIK